ncbi:outer membrane protein [Geobacter sp. DSM 9736]|uniref:outer membrane protein n=1 Tax=Geobacter sp. DSM 9736 TaxID=1277350 RepID=UPI000B508BDC|nr:acyloxyacyl hydrolase [Geobacter sp. DSM 9736]SNB48020.1 Outer membrane protein W [Geobacter sp. DSM 9736]
MKPNALVLIVIAMLLALAPAAALAEKPANYLMIKAGAYDPSNRFTISGAGGDGLDVNNETRFSGEVAIGHYFLPVFALELGAGYFENKGTAANQAGTVKLRVVPVVLTGKLLAQLGPVEPYILGGIGAYLTDFDADVTTSDATSSTKFTYGLHAGAGINFDVTERFFVGAEARYLWAEPEFGGRDIRLDGYSATGDLGFRF